MSDAPEAAPEATDVPKAKKPPKGAVLIGALVGGLVIGVAGGLFAVGPMVAKSSGYVVTADTTHAEGEGEAADGEHGAAAAAGEHAPEGEGGGGAPNLHLIDNLVLNPAGSNGTRFLMIAAAIEFKDAALVESFKSRDAEVRDIVLRVMGAKSVDQLSDMSMRDSLRRELADSLTNLVPKAQRKQAIRSVFFPQFVIQ
ncbi:MAG: flagellar basal body-associated FliL family protein [Gemmatimonadaceae bacterium]|nr:flagellar basal body-associated FliL family protein [Gemmatimonadaceae bacterium]